MTFFQTIKDNDKNYVLQTYTRQDVCLVKGYGSWVEDINGKKYIDFFPGWAVSGIGHCHKKVVSNIEEQLKKIMHVSNNYYNELQPVLAETIIKNSFPGKVFFANSGAEANEGAIKLARKYGSSSGRHEIITMEKSFHGRTLATLTATGQDKVKIGFSPLVEGFKHIPFNDIESFKKAITSKTIAVMLEPIQGEGGVNSADLDYLKIVARICEEKDILLILDEVQTGMGRTGKMFAYEHFGITPSAMTLAKSLGGGFPIGALVVAKKYEDILIPGSHASTFGGSPIAAAAALGVFSAIHEEKLLDNAVNMGEYLIKKLEGIKKNNFRVKKIKGKALMIGVELDIDDGSKVVNECVREGLLINCTQKNILRVMPPLTVNKEEIDLASEKLSKALERVS
ncbi:acetylornithine and succinylornithine aminotransferase [Candidatus Omnitrophus magneticus]|uniref:Acetylornithine aminotransferase n=1 Tax=Candidatus Omnitrophus magneticus TaxID=1609969 RepID=A0A0F0CU49_9BACT|nr:acetylornithine and succinylornithine aminotransferase [Candidatus Omnitrophus magneticus]